MATRRITAKRWVLTKRSIRTGYHHHCTRGGGKEVFVCVSVSTARLEVGVRGRGGRKSLTVLVKKKKIDDPLPKESGEYRFTHCHYTCIRRQLGVQRNTRIFYSLVR